MRGKLCAIALILVATAVTGCSFRQQENLDGQGADTSEMTVQREEEQRISAESEALAESYRSVYEAALEADTLDSLSVRQEMVSALGGAGCSAVDADNEINMENPDQVRQFCEIAEAGGKAEVTILSVLENGGFVRYDLQAEDGKLSAIRSILQWMENVPQSGGFDTYEVYDWSYTENGYLFFERYRPSGYDGPDGNVAIRVNPLDETCREFNRKYLETVGYARNNLFITDWTEEDYGEVDFYDLYDVFYTVRYGEDAYYGSRNVGGRNTDGQYTEIEYEVPQDEFEDVICSYFQVDRAVLRGKTVYHEQTETYRYRPRGVNDCGSGSVPYPEVTDYVENPDGTITLTVNAVLVEKKLDCAMKHEVTIRTYSDGTFEYVSNHVVTAETSVSPSWYKRRLSDEEWEKFYGSSPVFSDDPYGAMKNYEQMEAFLKKAAEGETSDVTAYKLLPDRGITRYHYAFDGEKMYVYTTVFSWDQERMRYTANETISEIKSWKYTEKGWFCYELPMPEYPEVTEVMNGNVMIRVKPMEEEYRQIAKQYLLPIGYKGNNLFCSDWNAEQREHLDYNGLFEALYEIEYQKNFDSRQYNGNIPSEEFECLMTKYLPVTSEQLRQWAVFDGETQNYIWVRLGCGNYSPNQLGTCIPEVTDILENEDGTLTVTVDAVCESIGEDAVFFSPRILTAKKRGLPDCSMKPTNHPFIFCPFTSPVPVFP